MTTQFETFDQSPGGAFIETAFESRGQQGEVLPAGCCCAWWTTQVIFPDIEPMVQHRQCYTLRWGPGATLQTCTWQDVPYPNWRAGMTFGRVEVPDEATAEALCLGMPEGDRIRQYEWVCAIMADPPLPPPGWPAYPENEVRWNAPCHCNSASGEPLDFEDQCGHIEGYCCALVLGQWELSPEGAATWQSHCTAEAQQQYYESPIEQVAFIQDPADPEHPCPEDPSTGRGWCCVTFQDLTTSSSLALGNEHEDACTVEGQLAAFAYLGLVVIAVNWIGQVDDNDCNPCDLPEGSCCLAGVPPLGLCMISLTATECGDLPQSTFTQGIDACTNCYEPDPLPPSPPWLGPSGRCCIFFEFWDGARWVEKWECGTRTDSSCAERRAYLENDPDRFRFVRNDGWTAGYQCMAEPDTEGLPIGQRQCLSEQGWCCGGDRPLRVEWRTRESCVSIPNFGRFYDALIDPDGLCDPENLRPCCVADPGGRVHCEMLIRSECQRLGGLVMGPAGTDCSSVDDDGNPTTQCEVGACCLGCSRCTDNMLPWHCDALVGEYRGHGTRCHEIDDCPEGAI